MKPEQNQNVVKDRSLLHTDADAAKGYWEREWAGRDYPEMLGRELYNFTFRATIDTVVKQCAISAESSVLDVGCGWGRLIIGMLKRFPSLRIHGVDVSSAAISRGPALIAQETGRKDIELHVARAESLPFDDAVFSAVMSSRVFQYVSDPVAALKEISRVLRPGGRVTVLVPNKLNPVRYFSYGAQLLTTQDLQRWMQLAGLEVTGGGSIVFSSPNWLRFSEDSFWVTIDRSLARMPLVRHIGGLAWACAAKVPLG